MVTCRRSSFDIYWCIIHRDDFGDGEVECEGSPHRQQTCVGYLPDAPADAGLGSADTSQLSAEPTTYTSEAT